MRDRLRQLIKRSPLGPPLLTLRSAIRSRLEEWRWRRAGRPAPAPHRVKRRVLREYGAAHGLRVLVETGTYLGDMVEAQRRHFEDVYSIELSSELHGRNEARFRGATNVHLLEGDSGEVLGSLCPQLDRPALFWLDGHYSAGITALGSQPTPVMEELRHILERDEAGDVVVIDDARCFGTEPGYPTVAEIEAVVRAARPEAAIAVDDDSIRLVLGGRPASS